jgi:hypothetical protein
MAKGFLSAVKGMDAFGKVSGAILHHFSHLSYVNVDHGRCQSEDPNGRVLYGFLASPVFSCIVNLVF